MAMAVLVTHVAMALSLAITMVAPVTLLTSYENGSPDNVSSCGNNTSYEDGRSGTYVATATSLAMATALAVAMGAPATRVAARTFARLGPMGSAVRTLLPMSGPQSRP